MEKRINEFGKVVFDGVTLDSPFSVELFNEVADQPEVNQQWYFHSNLGSITVLDRMTGYGYRDVETGFRDTDGKFILASGQFDVRDHGCDTVGDAIHLIKERADNCRGV